MKRRQYIFLLMRRMDMNSSAGIKMHKRHPMIWNLVQDQLRKEEPRNARIIGAQNDSRINGAQKCA